MSKDQLKKESVFSGSGVGWDGVGWGAGGGGASRGRSPVHHAYIARSVSITNLSFNSFVFELVGSAKLTVLPKSFPNLTAGE